MMQQRHKFFGGLRLEGHKSKSMRQPLKTLPLPKQLIFPLNQHIGLPAESVVSVGDTVLKGQMIACPNGSVSAAIHASSSGKVIAIEERPISHPSGMLATCIVIETDDEEKSIDFKTITGYQDSEPSILRDAIRDAGIVGLGGAGFPTFIKLNPTPGKIIETLILNGAECEPYITCDAMLMETRAESVLRGADILCQAVQAKQCLVGIEDNKPEAIKALKKALSEHTFYHPIEIVTIPTIYPTGGERQLIKVLTGHEISAKQRPMDVGLICQNVGTAAAVADAVLLGQPLIERIVTVTGNAIKDPANWLVPLGTPVQNLLAQHDDHANNNDIIIGGPMMGFVIDDSQAPVIKTTNCLLIQPHQVSKTEMPCIRCGECATVCPAQLLPQQLYWHARAKDFDKIQDYNLFDCIECGCCAHVCPSHIPLVQYYRFAKTEIWNREQDKLKSDRARERHEFNLHRLERKKQEDEERRRKKKELLNRAQGKTESDADSKKAAIEAAMARVKAKKEAIDAAPKNVDHLTPEQQKQIDEAEARRHQQTKDND